MTKNKGMTIVAVSGGFDPLHIGHIRLFEEAAKLGDVLVVILNNDNWVKAKKGKVFYPQEHRKALIEKYPFVNKVIITKHSPEDKDKSVCKELMSLNPDIFANGGDKIEDNIPEYHLCNELGIKMIFNVGGGKIASSSELIKK